MALLFKSLKAFGLDGGGDGGLFEPVIGFLGFGLLVFGFKPSDFKFVYCVLV